jgi:hypothetical protein
VMATLRMSLSGESRDELCFCACHPSGGNSRTARHVIRTCVFDAVTDRCSIARLHTKVTLTSFRVALSAYPHPSECGIRQCLCG